MRSKERSLVVAKNINVVVVSVGGASTGVEGRSGDLVKESLERGGHITVRRVSVRNDLHEVQRTVREGIEDRQIGAIVIVGGTGLAKDDVTLEAIEPFEEKSIPGFGEALRQLSASTHGQEAILVRGTAFVSERKVVFCIPASEDLAQCVADRLIGPVLEKAIGDAAR